MQFLTLPDLHSSISEHHLEQILPCGTNGAAQAVLNDCELRAITTVKEFLSSVYDIEYELSLSGSDRSVTLVSILVDLFKKELFQLASTVTDTVADRYLEAIERLKEGQKGIRTFDLKEINTGEDQNNLPFRYGFSKVSKDGEY